MTEGRAGEPVPEGAEVRAGGDAFPALPLPDSAQGTGRGFGAEFGVKSYRWVNGRVEHCKVGPVDRVWKFDGRCSAHLAFLKNKAPTFKI